MRRELRRPVATKVALIGFLWQILYTNVYVWNLGKNGRVGLICKEETQTFVGRGGWTGRLGLTYRLLILCVDQATREKLLCGRILYSLLRDLNGEKVQERDDMCKRTADSLCWPAETDNVVTQLCSNERGFLCADCHQACCLLALYTLAELIWVLDFDGTERSRYIGLWDNTGSSFYKSLFLIRG